MSNAFASSIKWAIISAGLVALATIVVPVQSQQPSNQVAPHTGFVDDWTHHHVVFSNPGTRDEAVKNGTLDKWTRITNDPRYRMQQVKRTLGTRSILADPNRGSWDAMRGHHRDRHPNGPDYGAGVKRDWSAPLGGGGSFTSGHVGGTVPGGANFTNNSTLTIELTFFDFDFGLLTLQASDAPGCVASGGTDYPHYVPATFCYTATSTAAQIATSVAQAFNLSWLGEWFTAGTNGSGGITITSKFGGGDPIFLSIVASDIPGYTSGTTAGVLATVQPNAYPAKYSWSTTTASCATDFVVYPTGQAGSTTAANIIAYNELYGSTPAGGTGDGTGCDASGGVNVPTAYWAYNTGTNEAVSTSPVLSSDGTQVAFVESTGSAASLVLLKWKSSTTATISAPVTPTAATAATYRACTAPCMLTIAFSGGHDDSGSAPYYDYIGDAIYVGDNSGGLQKFSGVFTGTPALAGSPWPVALSGQLSSPVYDSTSGNIWVGNMSGALYSVTSAGVSNGSSTIGDAIADGPLIDSTSEQVYVFVGDCVVCSDTGADAVLQLPAGGPFIPSVQELGIGGAGYYLYSGTFDNSYYSSESSGSTTPTGFLYVMGNTGPGSGGGNLYQVPINSGVLGTATAAVIGVTASGVSPWPSPVTEYYNTNDSADYIFFSVNAGTEIPFSCTTVAENGGCVLSFTVTGGSINGSGGQSLANVAGNGCWATGGISVDNSVAGDSDIYFVNMNGAEAGSQSKKTSSQCGTASNVIISAIQGTQAAP